MAYSSLSPTPSNARSSGGYRGPRQKGDHGPGRNAGPKRHRGPPPRPMCLVCSEPIATRHEGPQGWVHDRTRKCLENVSRDTVDLARLVLRRIQFNELAAARDEDVVDIRLKERAVEARGKAIAEAEAKIKAVEERLAGQPTGVPLEELTFAAA